MEKYYFETPHGIMFHHFHDFNIHPIGQGSISAEQFEKILILLGNNYKIVSWDEWYCKATTNSLTPREICITFDDNLLCQYQIALPVLEKFRIKAFWFVYTSCYTGEIERLEIYRYFRSKYFTDFTSFYNEFYNSVKCSEVNNKVSVALKKINPDDYLREFSFYSREDKIYRYLRDQVLTKEEYEKIMESMLAHYKFDIDAASSFLWNSKENLKYLSDSGHIIGLHSHNHPTNLKIMTFEDQKNQYELNHSCLSSIIGEPIITMSHPCNSYNEDTLNILKELNIKLGFRANMESGFHSNYEFPRIDHTYFIKDIKK